MVDSRHMPKNTVPPPVVIERVIADSREMPARSSMSFPPLTRNLEIDYTGLSFLEPRKVRFRYRLEGFNKDWQDAGTRRQAFYTNLQPRDYRFQVKAANNDDVWNESGARIDFAVLPAFYQTRLFSILCALAASATIWGIYRFRLQQIGAKLKSRFEERLSERTRIAQDLHDELVQSALGVSLQVELTDALVEDRHPAKPHVERALTLSRTLLQKGREVLRDLREKTTNVDDISRRLTETIEDVQAEGGPAARLVVEGEPRGVNHVVAEDFVQIGCEAIRNAFRHASATKIDVYIIYNDSELCLEVVDNGCGMPIQMMQSGKPGHYGLTGMRERTERIGGTLTITSRLKEGSKIAVSVPGKHAYVDGD
jgi:signal transduction histidine kinase